MITVDLPPLHSGQKEVWRSGKRFLVLSCGRRWGKSRLGVMKALSVAARKGRAWWIAPTYKMSDVGWRPLRQLAVQIPGAEVNKAERTITLPGGGSVSVRSADNPDSLRGEGLDFVVMDECAFMDESAWTEAIRPALADRLGKALFCSTPKGRNWYWSLWQRAQEADDWQTWQFTSYDNPFVPSTEIDAAKTQIPERVFRQEFLAEFIEDGGLVFRYVNEAATADRQESAQPGHQYIFGVDFGRVEDYTVVSVIDVTDKALVYIDRFNTIDWTMQVGRIQALHDRFRPTTIVAESNSMGDAVIGMLYERDLPVLPFTTTNATKQTIIDALALAFEQSQIRILKDSTLINELQAFEATQLPSGLVRYSAPAGLHDDMVMSLALAHHGSIIGDAQFG